MDSDKDLLRLIESGQTDQGEPISRLGYFCAPFRPGSGPYSDKVIKVYRSGATAADLDRLKDAHGAYVAVLQECGVTLPKTDLHMVETSGTRVPVVVQDALPAESMMRDQMIAGDRDETLRLMEVAGDVIATFWKAVESNPERVGFHPSIRNLAVLDGQGIFFDTFPPLIGYSRDEMGRLLITYSGSRAMRLLGPLLRQKITGIQDEWYSPPETLVGLVGSACRLRPDDAEAYLDWGRDFVRRRMPDHAEAALEHMQEAPQLPGYWVAVRKMLGLQGAPNV